MSRKILFAAVQCLIPLTLTVAFVAFAQEAAPGAAKKAPEKFKVPPLLFKESWAEVKGAPTEHPMTQEAVASPNLEIKLYGPSGKEIVENGLFSLPDNPPHLWTGLCVQTCAAALRDKNNYLDLTGLAKIKWQIHTSGFHEVRPIVKLADGTWLVGDHGESTTRDYHIVEVTLADQHWIKLDIDKVITRGNVLDKVDLSKVDEVGFTDLMPGSGHGDGGYSGVGWIEVYGKPVPRSGGASGQQQ